MKKLLFLSIIALFTVASANVFGQSTGTAPSPGAKHNYSVITHDGSTFLWSVTKGGLTDAAGTDAVISSPDMASTEITWATGLTVGDWYYVHILETVTATSCSNEKVLPVLITANLFYLTLAAANANDCYDGAVVVSLIGTSDIQYNHGSTSIEFGVTPNGFSTLTPGYSFDIALVVPEGYIPSVSVSENATIDGTVVTVSDNDVATITYVVNNTNLYSNSDIPAVADFTATGTISNGITINGIVDNGTGAKTGITAVARPNTSGITTN